MCYTFLLVIVAALALCWATLRPGPGARVGPPRGHHLGPPGRAARPPTFAVPDKFRDTSRRDAFWHRDFAVQQEGPFLAAQGGRGQGKPKSVITLWVGWCPLCWGGRLALQPSTQKQTQLRLGQEPDLPGNQSAAAEGIPPVNAPPGHRVGGDPASRPRVAV
jgi:hypothetical protein